MTRTELKKALEAGASLEEILPVSDGQECRIVKLSWPADVKNNLEEVIYIPDLSLNEIDYDSECLPLEEIAHIVAYTYTVRDFLQEASFNVELARDIFCQCDWQHPEIQDLKDCTDNDEAIRYYGESWDEIESRENEIQAARKELYRLYQLDWMIQHGYSLKDIIRQCEKYCREVLNEGAGGAEDASYDFCTELDESGLDGGEIFVGFDEFLDTEYRNFSYMNILARESPLGFSKLQKAYLTDTKGIRNKKLEILPAIA